MANIKFSQFTQKTTLGTVDFLVGYTGADNVQIDPADLLSDYSQGTGAAGQVTFFSAASTVTGDNDFYWNNANKRLGIGISSPNRLLHVNSNGQTDIHLTTNSQGTSASDGMTVFLDAAGSGGLWLRENADIRFATSGTERVRIKDGGNVGIGTTSPAAKLEVNGTLIATGISQLGSGGNNVYLTSSSAGNVGIGTSSPNSTTKLHISSPQSGAASGTGMTLSGWNGSGESLVQIMSYGIGDGTLAIRTGTSATERMRIDSSGNVGIGTTSPTTKFQVAGNSTYISVKNTSNYRAVDLGADSSGDGQIIMRDSSNNNKILFYAEANSNNYINNGGNFGIGTTSPSKKLTVKDTQYQLQLAGDNNYWNVGAGWTGYYDGSFLIGNSTGDRFVISSTGNVGIGTTSPSSILDVNGGSGNGAVIQAANAAAEYVLWAKTSNGTSRLWVGGDGNVGIGTISPLGKLQVNEYIVGSQGNQTIHGELSVFANNGDESLYLGVKDAAYPNRGWAFNPVITGVNSDLQIKEHGQTGVRMTLQSQGNVGIGTTNPDSPLEVQFQETTGQSKVMMHLDYNPNDNYGSSLFRMSAGTNSTAVTEIEQVTSGGNGDFGTYNDTNIINRSLGSISSGNINFITGSNTSASSIVMRICGGPSKGRVGIGTTSPQRKLTIYESSGNAVLQLANNTSGAGASDGFLAYTDGVNVGLENKENGYLSLATNASEKMRINSSGNVGIGTTSPATLFDIRGAGSTSNPATSGTTTSTGTRFRIGSSTNASAVLDFGISTSGNTWLQSTDRANLSATYPFVLNPNGGNVGIGTTSPASKLEVDGGDIEIDDSASGLILRSPDGTRYRVTVANGGTLSVSAV